MDSLLRMSRRRQQGVSLVELMVGLVIGAIAVLVVMQVFQLSEGSRRTTVGGDDAQMTGAIAISALQRDIKQAGYGASAFPMLGCSLLLPGGWTLPSLAAATINPQTAAAAPLIPGADANTDSLLFVFGSQNGSPEGDLVSAQAPQSVYSVATPTSFAVGDFVIAGQSWISPVPTAPRPVGVACNLTLERLTAVGLPPNPPTLTVATGTINMVGGTVFNLGPAPQALAYRVRNGNLTVCDFMVNNCSLVASVDDPAVWAPIANGVVSLRAQYARDTTAPAMDAVADVFDQTTPSGVNVQCEWARVSGLRLAVVSRSGEFNRDDVTVNNPVWAASDAAPIEIVGDAQARRFRYKTFETTAPLRNMAWKGVMTGC